MPVWVRRFARLQVKRPSALNYVTSGALAVHSALVNGHLTQRRRAAERHGGPPRDSASLFRLAIRRGVAEVQVAALPHVAPILLAPPCDASYPAGRSRGTRASLCWRRS